MKLDTKTIVTTLLLGLLTFIAGKVWEGVELAKENKVHREMMAEDIRELRADVKGVRHDLDQLYSITSDVAEEAQR